MQISLLAKLEKNKEFPTMASERSDTLLLMLWKWTLINAEQQRNSSSITYFTPATAAMNSL